MEQVPQDAVKNLNVKISGLQAQAFDFNNKKDRFDKSKPSSLSLSLSGFAHICDDIVSCRYFLY